MFARYLLSRFGRNLEKLSFSLPDYAGIRRGGERISLRYVIFHLHNLFLEYLHDTLSQSFFRCSICIVSHGCLRAERLYEQALYILGFEVFSIKEKYNIQ